MVSNSNADVLMLFGVEGGSDVTVKGSGKDMYDDIKEIVKKIQDDITKQLRFEASTDSLKALREQVETALSEAVNSIKGTPVELTFSFDQKSIDAAFAKVKKEMKEQQITVSAMPKEKKESKRAASDSVGSISKGTSEAKQKIEEVSKAAESASQEAQQAIKKETDAIQTEVAVQEELNKEIEKGLTLRERTLRISSSVSETPNGKVYTTTSRGLETGRIYTDTTKTIVDKEGIEQVIESFKFTNAQVNSALDNAQTKIVSLQKSMHSLYDMSDNKDFAHSLQAPITESINDVEDLINAISKAANHGYFGDLKELGFTDVKSAQDALQERIKNVNSQISNSKKLIQDNNNTLQKSIGLLDSIENEFNDILTDYNKMSSDDASGIGKKFEGDFKKAQSNFAVLSETARQALQSGDLNTFELVYQRMQEFVTDTGNDIQRINGYIKESQADWDQTSDSIRAARDQITGLSESIGKDGSLTLSDKFGITAQARKDLSGTIKHYQDLAAVLLDISEIGNSDPKWTEKNFDKLKKLGYNSVEEGYNALKLGVIEVDNQIKKSSKDISDNEKYWAKNQETVLKYADTLKKVSDETNKISPRNDDNVSKGIQNEITKLEDRANRLLTILSQLSNATRKTDQTKALNKLKDEFRVDTFEEGARLLTGYMSTITDKTHEANQAVSEFNREWDKSANSVQRLQEKFVDINRDLNKLKDIDVDNVASKLHSDISQAAVEAEQLAMALIEAANTGNTEHLQELGYESFEEGYRQLKIDLADIDDKMREANQAVAENERGWDKAANSVQKIRDGFLEIDRSFEKLKASDKNNVASELREDIDSAIGKAKELANALVLAAGGDESALSALGIKTFEEGYDKLRVSISDINDKMREANQAVANYDRSLNNLAQTQARVAEYTKEFTNLSSMQYNTSSPAYQALVNQQNLISKLSQAVAKGKDSFNASELDVSGINTYEQAVQMLTSELNKAEAALKEFKSTASNITDDAARLKLEEYTRVLNDLRNAPGGVGYAKAIESSIIPSDLQNDVQILQYVKEHYNEITEAIRSATNETARLNKQHREEENVMTQRNKIYQEADNYYKKYQSGIKANITLNQRWLDLINKINSGGFGTDNESARRALAELQTATKEANAETMSLWGSLKKLFTDHFGSVSATAFIGTLRNVMRMAYQNVLDIDKAMTELKKVTNETESTYEKFMGTAADLATKVGGTIADTISSTADFARLGFSLEQSTALSEAAMVYKNVGDGLDDINEASESIISTIKAFSDIDAKDAMSIIDKFNEVGKISVELPTPRLIQNKWQITISVKVQRWMRPRKECRMVRHYP